MSVYLGTISELRYGFKQLRVGVLRITTACKEKNGKRKRERDRDREKVKDA